MTFLLTFKSKHDKYIVIKLFKHSNFMTIMRPNMNMCMSNLNIVFQVEYVQLDLAL